jgi:orotate phosphoribosyltransferase
MVQFMFTWPLGALQTWKVFMDRKGRLVDILKEKSVRFGAFTLASGKQSDFYVDARQTTLNAEGALLVAEMVLEHLVEDVSGVGGPVTGADPIAGAVALLSAQRGRMVHGFMVRKQPKGHGAQQWVEGRANLPDGAKVCVVEDTVTTGGSLLRAVDRLERSGLTVVQCIAVVDREEGAAQKIEEAGYSFLALVGRSDLEAE